MERKYILRNEKGVALIIALIMLLILTLIGISSISTTTFETNISGNERTGTAAFYAAEAGIQVGIDLVPVPAITSISRSEAGPDAYYRGEVKMAGLGHVEGFDKDFVFKRYQINATGESFGSTKEIEAQISYGPVRAGTDY